MMRHAVDAVQSETQLSSPFDAQGQASQNNTCNMQTQYEVTRSQKKCLKVYNTFTVREKS